MKTSIHRIVLPLAAALALVPAGSGIVLAADGDANQSQSSQSQMSSAEILGAVAAVDRNELDAANEAVKKSVSARVLDYARMMQKEHGDNLDKVNQLASKLGVSPSSASGTVIRLRTKGTTQLATLSPRDGADFSSAYIKDMVDGHTEALDMIDNQLLKSAANDDVKSFLKDTRDSVSHHLDEAKKIQADLGTSTNP